MIEWPNALNLKILAHMNDSVTTVSNGGTIIFVGDAVHAIQVPY